jgi:XTP/dITP diphosphohydrolase
MSMKKILFATSNKGKLLEAQNFLSPLDFEVKQLKVAYPEIQARTLQEVASFGIHWISRERKMGDAVMLEDAGLFIHVLSDFPGVYSKWVYETIGLDGILKLMYKEAERSAHFEACLVFMEKGKEPIVFNGRVNGHLTKKPSGSNGFGYDPIFIAKGENKTFAEMTTEEKNKHSHRSRAFQKLIKYLNKN